MKYLTNEDNPAGDGWYDDAEAAVLLEHGNGWASGRAPAGEPDPSRHAAPHPDGRGAPAVPADPTGEVDASGRLTAKPKPAKKAAPKKRADKDDPDRNGGEGSNGQQADTTPKE